MQQTNEILNIFQGYRMAPTPIDEYEAVGKCVLRKKINSFVDLNKPINFVMLGYPMKSPNYRDKVLGLLPDLAEQVSLQNFGKFGDHIKSAYQPGISISIVSDGYMFNKLLETPDKIVEDYNNMSMDMAKVAPITWFQLNDFYSRNICSINGMRDKVLKQFGITELELERRILVDNDVNFLYRGMIKFLSLDLAIKDYPSGNQLHKAAKKVAKEMMLLNEAYSALIRSEFPNHIRLSMHPSVNNGVKYSFQLIPGPKAWTSPWHCALVDDGTPEYITIHKQEAEKQGLRLVYKDERPYNFLAN